MPRKEIELKGSQIIEDLNNGLYWLKAEDTDGSGSIQAKYNLPEAKIISLQNYPKLAGLQPADIVTVKFIDDIQDKDPAAEAETVAELVAVQEEPETFPTATEPEPEAEEESFPAHEEPQVDLDNNTLTTNDETGNFFDMV